MGYYKITNTMSGVFLGVYEAEDVDGALDALAQEAGFRDYEHAYRAGRLDAWDLSVKEITDRSITICVPSKAYEDFDDCLEAAADAERERRGLEGYDLCPRWEDDERDYILLDIPIEAATIEEITKLVQSTRR